MTEENNVHEMPFPKKPKRKHRRRWEIEDLTRSIYFATLRVLVLIGAFLLVAILITILVHLPALMK